MGGYAWVTLATNDSYSLGALVLAHSLKKSKTAHKSVVLITPAVSQPMREQLQTVFDVIKVVDVLDSKDEAHLALMQRPELGITFTKIHCWKLVEFDKCVFLDADTLVVRNCDELFEREEFSAAPDVSWPDCFNSGVFVYKPSVQTFNDLLQFAVEKGSFDGGDQGLLNQFFSGWATEDIKKHLPFVYNLTSVAAYSYIPAFKHYGSETRIVHFIGAGKPWLQQLDPATRTITPTSGSEHLAPLLQQWWDLFCEKVHPNLNKNLESNNDGMSHPPVAACSNSLPIALTDDSQTPRLIEPCTPYREKDDFRQSNLPYQPFDVKGSSGELLNVEFLLASVVRPTTPEVILDEQRRGGDAMEEKDSREEREEEKETDDLGAKENESIKEAESPEMVSKTDLDFRTEERVSEWKKAEVGEQKQEHEKQEQSINPEQPPPASHPFDYDSFFPDETCINKYLEQNVMTYQPYASDTCQQHENHHHHNNSEGKSPQHSQESNSEINHTVSDPQPPEDPAPSLPRFLTIPEDDKRQSGNAETQSQTKQADLQTESDLPRTDSPAKGPDHPPPQKEAVEEKRELTKSKSMPYLRYDVTEIPPSKSIWKSQPNVNVDPNRKYLMPKLKPILPRQNSLSRSVPSVAPKVTLYTEFLMSSEYKDPADLPKDKVGFVETLIHKKSHLRRSKSAADIGNKFGPLPYTFSPEIEQPAVLKKMPSLHLDSELYDLSQCKRQMGNKPKAKVAEERKENIHSLPALKPLVPPKDKKSTLIKKRKSKELSPGDGGREKILKREPKMPKERKRESKTTPRNVAEPATGNNVNEILRSLWELSKNYQHFFDVEPRPRDRTIKCKNATVQADDLVGGEWDTSECFLKTSSPGRMAVSRGTQTPGEEKSEREESSVDSKFRHFRNYVKEKSKTSQKGLLSIQDLVSKSNAREDEVAEDVNASSDTLDSCSELERGSGEGDKTKVGYLSDGAVERKDSAKGDGLVEGETPGMGIGVNQQSSAKGDEMPEGHRGNNEHCRTPANEVDVEDNSKETVKSVLHSTRWEPKEVKTSHSLNSPPADKSDSKDNTSDHSEEGICENPSFPVVSGAGDAVLSRREREAQTNGLGEENSESKACSTEVVPDEKLRSKQRGVGVTGEKSVSLKYNLREDAARTESPPSSCSDRIISGNGCSKMFRAALEAEEPAALTPAGGDPDEEILSELSLGGSAGMSSEGRILGEGNQPKTKTTGRSRAEAIRDGGTQTEHDESRDTPTPCCGRMDEMEEKGSRDKIKNTNNTPRSSQVPLPTSEDVAVEVIEELIAKTTLQQSPTSAPPNLIPRETPRPIPPPRKLSGPPPVNDNSPANDSPDRTAPPVGEGTCTAAAEKPSPSVPHNGNALPESHEDMKLNSGIAGAIAQLSLDAGSDRSSESAAAASTAHQEYVRRQNWETGNMDYLGKDSFDNIWSKICQTLEGKDLEEAGPAAVSPKEFKESLDPSATCRPEEARTPEQPPDAETLAPSSTLLQKCPEYIETLPGELTAGPVEDDEIIFSKPDNGQSRLTNITEVEDDGKESSALGAKPAEAGKVKLSDILQPEASPSVPKETGGTDAADELKKGEAKTPVQKTTEQASAEEKAGAPAGEKSEKPQKEQVPAEASKVECQTVAVCQPPFSPEQAPPRGGGDTSGNADKPGTDQKKTEECTTVAIPSPPISFPGFSFDEKDKKAQSRRKPEKTAEDKFDPIPLPPPETPTQVPQAKTSDSARDQGKQKKGVFNKILEMVGVTPKEKNEDEISKSVFYDVEGASEQGPAKDDSSVRVEPEKQAPTAAIEANEFSPKQGDDSGKSPDAAGEVKTEEIKETQEKVVPAAQSKDAEETSPLESEETKRDTTASPPGTEAAENAAQKEPHEATKLDGKPKSPIEKPSRKASPKDPAQLPKNSIQISPKSKSPSPKLTLSKDPPETAVTMPTPPPQPDFPVRKNSGLLKVEETVLETPPIPESPKEGTEESVKGRVLTEVEDIIGKARKEVESRLQDRRSADKETGESSDLINTMKLMMESEEAAQVQSPEVQMEELRVTSEEERMRHKGEVVSSKLSDQILKAIPPPRRKAISEGSASTSAIPKPPPDPEQKTVPGETKPKTPKPSSIPVPPPRNRGKPTQPVPSKGKGKK